MNGRTSTTRGGRFVRWFIGRVLWIWVQIDLQQRILSETFLERAEDGEVARVAPARRAGRA